MHKGFGNNTFIFTYFSKGNPKQQKQSLSDLTIGSVLFQWVRLDAFKGPLPVGYTIQEAASLDGGVGTAPVLGHAIQISPVKWLRHVLLEVLGIGEHLSALLESLCVGQVSSRQPIGIPHAAQREEGVSEALTARLSYTNKNKNT